MNNIQGRLRALSHTEKYDGETARLLCEAAAIIENLQTESEEHMRIRRKRADEIDMLRKEVKLVESQRDEARLLGDRIAHQINFHEHEHILSAWWKARGGQSRCSVCNPPGVNPHDHRT